LQEYDNLGLTDLESELFNGSEDFSNDREYQDDDDVDDNLSYVETGRSLAMFNITEPVQQSALPADVINFNDGVSDDSDEEQDYMAMRTLVLYGRTSVCYFC